MNVLIFIGLLISICSCILAQDYQLQDFPERALIVYPSLGMGLCNQIRVHIHGLYLALHTNRSVIASVYHPQLHSYANEIASDKIFDFGKINHNIQHYFHINTTSLVYAPMNFTGGKYQTLCLRFLGATGMPGIRKCSFTYWKIANVEMQYFNNSYTVDLLDVLKVPEVDKWEWLAFSNGIPFRETFQYDENLMKKVYQSWEFTDNFNIDKAVLKDYNIISNNYTTLHLRFEDDWIISNFDWGKQAIEPLTTKLELVEVFDIVVYQYYQFLCPIIKKTDNIFISSGLNKTQNHLNYMIDQFKVAYPHNLMHIKSYLPYIQSNHSHHDDKIFASVYDLNMAMHAKLCIGIGYSTFSEFLSHRCEDYSSFSANLTDILLNYTPEKAREISLQVRDINYLSNCIH